MTRAMGAQARWGSLALVGPLASALFLGAVAWAGVNVPSSVAAQVSTPSAVHAAASVTPAKARKAKAQPRSARTTSTKPSTKHVAAAVPKPAPATHARTGASGA